MPDFSRFLVIAFLITITLNPMLIAQQQSAQDTPERQPPIDVRENSIGMKLALIPAGSFTMGSPLDEPHRDDKEVPHRVVITRPFYMGVYEVTQGQFAEVTGGKRAATFRAGKDHPMETIEYGEALDFLDQLSARPAEKEAGLVYRLPSEAEWEYACRAGTETAYHVGASLSAEEANIDGRLSFVGAATGPFLRKTKPVGTFPPNAFGLYDMHGNVWEYCADWYDANYYRDSPVEDPLGPPVAAASTDFESSYVVIRGGGWIDDARACRSAYRYRAMPKNRYHMIGLRVVADVPEEAE